MFPDGPDTETNMLEPHLHIHISRSNHSMVMIYFWSVDITGGGSCATNAKSIILWNSKLPFPFYTILKITLQFSIPHFPTNTTLYLASNHLTHEMWFMVPFWCITFLFSHFWSWFPNFNRSYLKGLKKITMEYKYIIYRSKTISAKLLQTLHHLHHHASCSFWSPSPEGFLKFLSKGG